MNVFFDMKKFLTVSMLALAVTNITMPSYSQEVTQGDVLNKVNGNYGADLKNVSGAKVETDFTKATITNTQKNSVLNWNSLNTAKGQELNFVMKDGQTSLNKVTGTGLSTFAGGINSEHGRVIISNPNGMIFENGSYINANSVVLTTHNAEFDANNNKLKLTSNSNNASIKFFGGNIGTDKVRLNIAKDLNIVSNRVFIRNAEIVAGDVKLVTSDGVTFYEVNDTNKSMNMDYKSLKNSVHNTDDNSFLGNVSFEGSNVSIKNNETGKIYIVAKGNVQLNKTKYDGKIKVDGNNFVQFYDCDVKNADITAGARFSHFNLSTSGVLSMDNSTINATSISIYAGENNQINGVKVTNSTLNASWKMDTKGAQFDNSKIIARNNTLDISNTSIVNSTVESLNNSLNLSNSILDNSKVSTKSVKINGTSLLNGTVLSANLIEDDANNVTIKNSTLKVENGNLNLKKSLLYNANVSTNNGNIYVETETINGGNFEANGTFQAKSSNWKKVLTLDDVKITAGSGIKLMSTPEVKNSTLITTNENSYIDIQKSNILKTTINSYTIYGQNSTIINSNFDVKNDIIVSSSNISNTTLTAIKDLKLEYTTLDNVDANGRYVFLNNAVLENGSNVSAKRLSSQGTNDYVSGNIVYKAGMTVENLTIENSTLNVDDDVFLKDSILDNAKIITSAGKNLNIDTVNDVVLVGSKIGGDLNITKANNVVISNSTESGSQYIPDMTTKSPVTDYDRTKYTDDDFITIANNYGDIYGNGTNLTNISGNLNISNTNDFSIINTVIKGSFTIENVVNTGNIITSLVDNDLVINNTSTVGDMNIYKSYINGNYTSRFDYQLSDKSTATVSNISASAYDDVNKRKYGVDVNTKFQNRFIPRGFAAAEDELNLMKSETKSSLIKTDKNVKVTKSFHAY